MQGVLVAVAMLALAAMPASAWAHDEAIHASADLPGPAWEEIAKLPVAGLDAAVPASDLPAPAEPSPGRFELVGHSPLLNRGMNAALAVWKDHAYVGSRTDGTHLNSGVLVVDVSDAARPEVVNEIGLP